MYRVAVIVNENEYLRSGYANTVAWLRTLPRFSTYQFEQFSSVNIAALFRDGGSHISTFDSVLIATNATSDRALLDALRDHRDAIAAFLASGNGIFISSQKKLSIAEDGPTGVGIATHFLPEQYDFVTRERPKSEPDSGQGRVDILDYGTPHIILSYPYIVKVDSINATCASNGFRRHFYRSHLQFVGTASYIPILGDISYSRPPIRVLLAASHGLGTEVRVVVSTIALDWEQHADLVSNILVFITEGPPNLALIRKPACRNDNFDLLISGAALSQISHVVYEGLHDIPAHLLAFHTTFVFASDWNEADISDFLESKWWKGGDSLRGRALYRRVYYFRKFGAALALAEYSTFDSIDMIVDQACLWLRSKFGGGMWAGSFWTTYDVLDALTNASVDCSPFVGPVLRDIRQHYKSGSYDFVMGASCGLLQLLANLRGKYAKECAAAEFRFPEFESSAHWIVASCSNQSMDDKVSAYVAVRRVISSTTSKRLRSLHESPSFISLDESVREGMADADFFKRSQTEGDVCRLIELVCIVDGSAPQVNDLLEWLSARQSTQGEWSNVGRTSHVLLCLLQNRDAILRGDPTSEELLHLDTMTHKAAMFLQRQFDWQHSNWDGDLQATAKAAHALTLYRTCFPMARQDVLRAIRSDADSMRSAAIIQNVGAGMENLHKQLTAASADSTRLQQLSRRLLRLETLEQVWRIVALLTASLLVATIGFLATDKPSVFSEAFKAIGLPAILVGLVLSLLAGLFINRKRAQ